MTRVRLIHWKVEEAETHINTLTEAGYRVEYDPFGRSVLNALRQNPPMAVVIDLNRLPSQGREVAVTLRNYKTTRQVPLVFVGGASEKVARIQELLPDAEYCTWETVLDAIGQAIANPPAEPVVFDSVFAAYAGTPLAKKLGIKPGARVNAINPPEDIEQILGELPEGVRLHLDSTEIMDVNLWFLRSKGVLDAQIDRMVPFAAGGPLWMIWPKRASKLTCDLTQPLVRQTGLDAGLVDYKVCSVDRTWTGLCFTKRK